VPIRSAGRVQGRIFHECPEDECRQTKVLLEHAATAAGLWFLRQNAVEETETRLHGDFIWHLANGELRESWDMIHSRDRSFGLDLNASYVCLLGKVERTNPVSTEAQQKNINHDIVYQIHTLREAMNTKTIVTSHLEALIVYLETPPAAAKEQARSFCRLLDRKSVV